MQKDKPTVPAEVENAITEKKKRGWVSNPQENFGQENIQPGDNAKYLRHALAAYNLSWSRKRCMASWYSAEYVFISTMFVIELMI